MPEVDQCRTSTDTAKPSFEEVFLELANKNPEAVKTKEGQDDIRARIMNIINENGVSDFDTNLKGKKLDKAVRPRFAKCVHTFNLQQQQNIGKSGNQNEAKVMRVAKGGVVVIKLPDNRNIPIKPDHLPDFDPPLQLGEMVIIVEKDPLRIARDTANQIHGVFPGNTIGEV